MRRNKLNRAQMSAHIFHETEETTETIRFIGKYKGLDETKYNKRNRGFTQLLNLLDCKAKSVKQRKQQEYIGKLL